MNVLRACVAVTFVATLSLWVASVIYVWVRNRSIIRKAKKGFDLDMATSLRNIQWACCNVTTAVVITIVRIVAESI